jgi:tetratricopeptide (TPR) repeat protein
MARKNYAAAEPLLQHALDIWQLEFGPDEVRTVAIRNVLALLYAHMRRYDEAVRHERQAVGLLERAQGSHPLLAKLYANLGAIYTAAGRGQEAEESCRNALRIAKAAFGSDSPFTVSLLRAHAAQLRKLNRDEEAAAVERALRDIEESASHGRGHTVDVRELGR